MLLIVALVCSGAGVAGGVLIAMRSSGTPAKSEVEAPVSKADSGLAKSCSLPELVDHLLTHKIASRAAYAQLDRYESRPVSSIKNERVPYAYLDGNVAFAEILIAECDDDLSAKHFALTLRDMSKASLKLEGARSGVSEKQLDSVHFSWGRFMFFVQKPVKGERIKKLLG